MSLNDELLAALLMQQVGGGGKKTAVDKTLGVEGAAADAKAVGDALSKKHRRWMWKKLWVQGSPELRCRPMRETPDWWG